MAMMNEMEYRTIGSALAGGYRAAVYCRLSKDDDLQGESASIAAILMVTIMLPFFFMAMYEKDGLPFEKVVANIIRQKFICPPVRDPHGSSWPVRSTSIW